MFWNDNYIFVREPLKTNRWFIRFGNDLDNYVFGLKDCTKPSYDISVTEHRHITGHVFRYPGTLKWKPITFKYVAVNEQYDEEPTIIPSTKDIILNSIFNETYVAQRKQKKVFKNNSLTRLLELTKTGTQNYKNPGTIPGNFQNIEKDLYIIPSVEIIQVDDDGDEQEIWTLKNAFISSINYGNLSYATDDFVEITLTMQYDWAEQADVTGLERQVDEADGYVYNNYTYDPPKNSG